eukprot:TRINITY_DN13709_c0_g1_i1.p1 TRINITY_DN13709_c0_g1~~TRINITY_DN13709_c0_g1_i1.p1  ORF type:complete len:934 (+),score=95.80 TRINITY_DN13709_c0_g1_i1:50-2803(+)
MAVTNVTSGLELAGGVLELRICEAGSEGGLFFPWGVEEDLGLASGLRTALYLIALLYAFLGVNIISDRFMTSIEAITAMTYTVQEADGSLRQEVVWNDTVANLTLIALGSSAPEILLSIVEVWKNGWYSGQLGPATIVASAAFNLFIIISICQWAVKKGESRRVKAIEVFLLTALVSIMAYLWLFFIVQMHTPDVIDVSESAVTLGFFPAFVWISFLADRGLFSRGGSADVDKAGTERLPSQELFEAQEEARTSVSGIVQTRVDDTVSTRVTHTSSRAQSEGRESQSSESSKRSGKFFKRSNSRSVERACGLAIQRHNTEKTIVDADTEQTWCEQVREACRVPRGEDEEIHSCTERLLLVIAAPWKVFFAVFTIPSSYLGGFPAFCVCLLHIGVLTGGIADLAELLGCMLDIDDFVTAITLVALGTSLPDAAASYYAASEDDCADAAIVNVTGSNSVNVFLGIGLPWLMASCYWYGGSADIARWRSRYPAVAELYPDGAFVVEAGNLGFSVIVFLLEAMVCIIVLLYRRVREGGELGGSTASRAWTSAILVMLWVVYLSLGIWQSQSGTTISEDVLAWCFCVGIVMVIGMLVLACLALRTQQEPNDVPSAVVSRSCESLHDELHAAQVRVQIAENNLAKAEEEMNRITQRLSSKSPLKATTDTDAMYEATTSNGATTKLTNLSATNSTASWPQQDCPPRPSSNHQTEGRDNLPRVLGRVESLNEHGFTKTPTNRSNVEENGAAGRSMSKSQGSTKMRTSDPHKGVTEDSERSMTGSGGDLRRQDKVHDRDAIWPARSVESDGIGEIEVTKTRTSLGSRRRVDRQGSGSQSSNRAQPLATASVESGGESASYGGSRSCDMVLANGPRSRKSLQRGRSDASPSQSLPPALSDKPSGTHEDDDDMLDSDLLTTVEDTRQM